MNVNNQYTDQNETATQPSDRRRRNDKQSEITSISAISEKKSKQLKNLKDGIVGLKNNSLYCYMNACLQCLLPITVLRDYYMNNEFKRFHNTTTLSNSNEYSRKMAEFLGDVFSSSSHNDEILNPTGLKNLIRKKFTPMM